MNTRRGTRRALSAFAVEWTTVKEARVAATYHCSRMSLVVDVGGGHGRLLATILGGAIPCHRSSRDAPGLHADLEMLVNVGVRERTTDEYALLLARSGLRLAQTISLGRPEEPMWHHLIEAQPV